MNLSCVKKDDSFEEKYMPVIKLINDYLFNYFNKSPSGIGSSNLIAKIKATTTTKMTIPTVRE